MVRSGATHSNHIPATSRCATVGENEVRRPKIAYIVSRFPKLTETFILYEILAMEQHLGIDIELYPLLRQNERVLNPEVQGLAARAHYEPFVSWQIVRANIHYLLKKPRTYLSTLRTVLRATLPSKNFLLGALAFFPKSVLFARSMEQQRVAHVHAHFANHPAMSAFVVSHLTGIPFSFTARGSDIHLDRCMLKEKVHACAFAIAVSGYNRNLIVHECGEQIRNKVHVIFGGIDTKNVCPAVATRPAKQNLTILSIGRFEDVKGQRYLVAACELLRTRGCDFECHLIGEGPLVDEVRQQIANSGLNEHVRISGFCTHKEVIEEMRRATVVVLATAPTRGGECEGIPNVLKEAMACGLPVVASNVGGIPELVEDGVSGILVPPCDPVALADALLQIAANPTLGMRMGQAGREKIVREFNLDASTHRRAALFLGDITPGLQSPPQRYSVTELATHIAE